MGLGLDEAGGRGGMGKRGMRVLVGGGLFRRGRRMAVSWKPMTDEERDRQVGFGIR